MKTNHKQTYSCVGTSIPFLRHVTTRNLAVAMFVAVALVGTTRGSDTERMAMGKGNAKPAELSGVGLRQGPGGQVGHDNTVFISR